MNSISLDRLKPGMVLAEAAYNFQGVLLLSAGSILTNDSIRILKSWGVGKVTVEGRVKKVSDADEHYKSTQTIH